MANLTLGQQAKGFLELIEIWRRKSILCKQIVDALESGDEREMMVAMTLFSETWEESNALLTKLNQGDVT